MLLNSNIEKALNLSTLDDLTFTCITEITDLTTSSSGVTKRILDISKTLSCEGNVFPTVSVNDCL